MDGRLFLLYKFRTMKADADPELHREYQRAFIAGRAEANLGNDKSPLTNCSQIHGSHESAKFCAAPVSTKCRNFQRSDRRDELVGPRPPIPYEVEAYELWRRKRAGYETGLTGLWQVSGRNRLPFEEMVRLDLFYIENWSLLLDLKIILRTGFVMLGREGF